MQISILLALLLTSSGSAFINKIFFSSPSFKNIVGGTSFAPIQHPRKISPDYEEQLLSDFKDELEFFLRDQVTYLQERDFDDLEQLALNSKAYKHHFKNPTQLFAPLDILRGKIPLSKKDLNRSYCLSTFDNELLELSKKYCEVYLDPIIHSFVPLSTKTLTKEWQRLIDKVFIHSGLYNTCIFDKKQSESSDSQLNSEGRLKSNYRKISIPTKTPLIPLKN